MVAATSFQREEDEVQQSNSQKFLYYSIKNPLTFPTSLSCSKASTSKTHEKKIMLATSQGVVFSTSSLQRANRDFLPAVHDSCSPIFPLLQEENLSGTS